MRCGNNESILESLVHKERENGVNTVMFRDCKWNTCRYRIYINKHENKLKYIGVGSQQGWGQIRFIKYKYKYKYIFFWSFKYKYKYKYTGKNVIKYKYKYKYSSSNTNTNTNTQWGRDKIAAILQPRMTY